MNQLIISILLFLLYPIMFAFGVWCGACAVKRRLADKSNKTRSKQ